MKRLQRISLEGRLITLQALEYLAPLPALASIDLRISNGFQISKTPVDGFAALREFTVMSSAWPRGEAIDSDALLSLIGGATNLEILDLPELKMDEITDETLDRLSRYPKLRLLRLYSHHVRVTIEGLAGFRESTNLDARSKIDGTMYLRLGE